MAKHPPGRRPKPETDPKPPRNRLAEIQAEIREVQQQIEHLRRDPRVISNAEDVRSWERQITELTQRLSGLLLTEAMQRASDQPENIQKARSLTQGAGHKVKDQGKRDVTLRTTCGVIVVRVTYFSRNCDRERSGKGMYPILLLWGMHDRCTSGVASEVSKLVAMLRLAGGGRAGVGRSRATAGPQDHPVDGVSLRGAGPCRPAYREPELGRDRRGPARDPLRGWRPDSDPHDEARPEDGQGTQPLPHGLARAEVADHLRGG